MPVRSVNSFSYFCRTSPRGLLIRLTPIFVPANFFQLGSAKAGVIPPRPQAAAGGRGREKGSASEFAGRIEHLRPP